jgi:hypothetical protein
MTPGPTHQVGGRDRRELSGFRLPPRGSAAGGSLAERRRAGPTIRPQLPASGQNQNKHIARRDLTSDHQLTLAVMNR